MFKSAFSGIKYSLPGSSYGEIKKKLLKIIKKLNLNCVGVAFHVGTGAVSLEAYKCSIEDARKVFDMA